MNSFIFTYKFICIYCSAPYHASIVSVKVLVPNGYLVFVIDRCLLARHGIITHKNRLSTNGFIKITLFDLKIFIFIAIFSLLSVRLFFLALHQIHVLIGLCVCMCVEGARGV